MQEERIKELEAQLAVANAALQLATEANGKLKEDLAAAELAHKRSRRSSRSAESSLQDRLSAAQRNRAW